MEGFELSVTDYLLKPFSLERFLQAILKVQKLKVPSESFSSEKDEVPTDIFVKSDKKMVKLSYIEAYGNYIKIYTETMTLTPQTLSDFLEKLPGSFIRIHKPYVINFKALQLIDGNQIVLQNNTKLPIGKSYRKAVLNRI